MSVGKHFRLIFLIWREDLNPRKDIPEPLKLNSTPLWRKKMKSAQQWRKLREVPLCMQKSLARSVLVPCFTSQAEFHSEVSVNVDELWSWGNVNTESPLVFAQ